MFGWLVGLMLFVGVLGCCFLMGVCLVGWLVGF